MVRYKGYFSNRLIVCAIVFLLANVIYYVYRKNRKSVTISGKTFTVKVEYGDLLEIGSGKIVINFDECFSTSIGNKPEDIKPNSVCGQYLMKYPIEDMQALIKESGLKSVGESLYNKKPKYAHGSIIPRGNYLLMAFAKLDKSGLGRLKYDKYIDCLNTMWEQIDRYHGTDDVYLPVLGSGVTRIEKELTQQELLDIMIASYRVSPMKLKKPNVLHIVCREREDFSINDVFGVN